MVMRTWSGKAGLPPTAMTILSAVNNVWRGRERGRKGGKEGGERGRERGRKGERDGGERGKGGGRKRERGREKERERARNKQLSLFSDYIIPLTFFPFLSVACIV